ncbi:hypothetical protein DL98DRAFT_564391 [Cadophora sp. DSE1049]|nr:hypothetical protein DL98DRAFT_564391 [Cadophora sp. DSE1049]
MRAQDLPSFKDMPAVKGMPHGAAWGLFDKDGERDNCGTLNLLAPGIAKEAQKEIRSGTSVALNWGLENVHEPGFTREKAQHHFKDLKPLGFFAWDDLIHINTQSGSQWDGFRHWGHQETGLYYNGLKHEEIPDPKHICDNSQHHWTERGGIVGRAVLIDFASWAEKKGISYSATSRHEISIQDVEPIAKDQGEWLWDHHFAAVAGDAIAFEAWPPKAPYRLHDHFLAFWGTPIGELWNLEGLAEACKRENKYSFMLTSAPLNIQGGVASPPNAIAIL